MRHDELMRGMGTDLTIGERVAWYRRRRGAEPRSSEPPTLQHLRLEVAGAWEDYQASRYGRLTRRLTPLLAQAQAAAAEYDGPLCRHLVASR
jgi:hypothetical protein